ncbi:unnamed protein product [Symbiodinium sp. CCMP2592]|nr:unnamed protein product [Symbiodinium sp. CCMP2592]
MPGPRPKRCTNPACDFLVHPDATKMGSFCCKKCHYHYSVGSEKGKSLAHGDLCKRTKAPADAAPAEYVAPEAPLPAATSQASRVAKRKKSWTSGHDTAEPWPVRASRPDTTAAGIWTGAPDPPYPRILRARSKSPARRKDDPGGEPPDSTSARKDAPGRRLNTTGSPRRTGLSKSRRNLDSGGEGARSSKQTAGANDPDRQRPEAAGPTEDKSTPCDAGDAGTNKAVSKDQAHVKDLEEQIRALFVLKPRELEDSCSTASESSPSVEIGGVEKLSDGRHSKSRSRSQSSCSRSSRSRGSRSRSYSRSSSADSDSTDDEPGRDQTDPKGPKDTKDAVPGPASVSSARGESKSKTQDASLHEGAERTTASQPSIAKDSRTVEAVKSS